MAHTISITGNQDCDDDSSSSSFTRTRKRCNTFDDDGVVAWSDVNHDVLFMVMMKVGVVDFLASNGVCKSWRLLGLSIRNTFMASKPPMEISFDPRANYISNCYLEDFEGRRFKSILPHSANSICYGVSCGYLILFGRATHDFWLVNPITRHQLHFPDYPLYECGYEGGISAILVFSPSISGSVFVVLNRNIWRDTVGRPSISYYIEGKQGWSPVSSTLPYPSILDLHFFKGKIYTLHFDCSVGELRLHPNQNHKWTSLETNNFPKRDFSYPELVNSNETLYVINRFERYSKVLELDFGEMKWVSPEKTVGEYAFFYSNHHKSAAAIKPESWAGLRTQYKTYDYFLETQQQMFYYNYKRMWYFPHDCLNVNILDE